MNNIELLVDKNKSPAGIIDLLARAVDSLGLDASSMNKLNLKTLDYSYRCRAVENENGKSKIMDRGFIGLIKNKINQGDSQAVVNCFIYGKKTLGFYIENNSIYANEKLKRSSDFVCLLFNCIENQKLVFQGWVDTLPTGIKESTSTTKTLQDCINTSLNIDNLQAELGF